MDFDSRFSIDTLVCGYRAGVVGGEGEGGLFEVGGRVDIDEKGIAYFLMYRLHVFLISLPSRHYPRRFGVPSGKNHLLSLLFHSQYAFIFYFTRSGSRVLVKVSVAFYRNWHLSLPQYSVCLVAVLQLFSVFSPKAFATPGRQGCTVVMCWW